MTFSALPIELMHCHEFKIGNVRVGGPNPLVLIAGPCVIESHDHVLGLAAKLKETASFLGIPYVFKASFDKANRSSSKSYRGPGLESGLKTLAAVKEKLGLPVLTDVHEAEQAGPVADVCDILQIPAFLARQTDFVQAVGSAGKPVNLKKAQFMAPEDVKNVVDKLMEVGCRDVLLTERGASFGYHNLVADMRGLAIMRESTGMPVCFDATHSVQQPGGMGTASGGQREFVPLLSRAACGAGIHALFLEVHEDPDNAKSDGPNMVPLDQLEALVRSCMAIDGALRRSLAQAAL